MEILDKFDLVILKELQADGRLSNAELAQRVGLSAAPCWRRVKALEEAGFIKGYRAEIDRRRIGLEAEPGVVEQGDVAAQIHRAGVAVIDAVIRRHRHPGAVTHGHVGNQLLQVDDARVAGRCRRGGGCLRLRSRFRGDRERPIVGVDAVVLDLLQLHIGAALLLGVAQDFGGVDHRRLAPPVVNVPDAGEGDQR